MIADLFTLRSAPGRGRGLFARHFIPRGTVIGFECDRCRTVCSRAELLAQPVAEQERILEHAFLGEEGRVILDCSLGRFMNHGCEANVLEAPQGFDIAVRDIAAGEEAVCDYRQFDEPIELAFPCRCGAAGCAGRVDCGRPDAALRRRWTEQLTAALAELRVPAVFCSGVGPGEVRRFGGEQFHRRFGRASSVDAAVIRSGAGPAAAGALRDPSQTTS